MQCSGTAAGYGGERREGREGRVLHRKRRRIEGGVEIVKCEDRQPNHGRCSDQ
jgi:hypothetical protein